MKEERGVMIAAYKQERNPRFVVLNRKKNWEGWELPKGHLEEDDYEETVRIELEEEAGISEEQIVSVESLDHTVEWEYEEDETIRRKYKAFIVKLEEDALISTRNNPHDEHEKGFFLRKDDADRLLTHENNSEVLELAYEKIQG